VAAVGLWTAEAARQAQVARVRAHDGHASTVEPIPQERDPLLVELDGDDVRAGAQQLGRDRTATRADVEHELAG